MGARDTATNWLFKKNQIIKNINEIQLEPDPEQNSNNEDTIALDNQVEEVIFVLNVYVKRPLKINL